MGFHTWLDLRIGLVSRDPVDKEENEGFHLGLQFADREIDREIKFPDRESWEIGKYRYLCTFLDNSFPSNPWNTLDRTGSF